MNTQKKARSLYWDIVKGWGIIAIVLGHTGYFAGAFVYLFHLALFFFITGYFYNETKYGDTPVSLLRLPSRRCMAQVYVLHAVFCPASQLFCDAPGSMQARNFTTTPECLRHG